jgi:CRISPR-associated protein (TIGR02584 family)
MPSKKILLCVSGLSPQIVTETLYALAVSRQSAWVPDEVWLLTTVRGADKAKAFLLGTESSWFQRLIKDWNLPEIRFDETHIKTLTDPNGEALSDIRDDIDNQVAADEISNFVRRLASEDDTEIHASIAGGRKTMGFFMGYAMSLWGRSQDRLSHVLVSSPFEGRSDFYYPTPYSHQLERLPSDADDFAADAQSAQVWLGDIPFVRLRSLLPESFKAKGSSFDAAVHAANMALSELILELDVSALTLILNGTRIKLPPLQFSLVCVMAHRTLQEMSPLRAPLIDVDDPDWKKEVYDCLAAALGHQRVPGRVRDRLRDSKPIGTSFNEQISKLERRIENSGAIPMRRLVTRESDGKGRQRLYRLDVNKQNLQISVSDRTTKPMSANALVCEAASQTPLPSGSLNK